MGQVFSVSVTGTDTSFNCQSDQTLLAAMERSGVKLVTIGCRGGGCGVCKVQIEDGDTWHAKMSRAHVSQEEEDAGLVLACCVKPKSDITISLVDGTGK